MSPIKDENNRKWSASRMAISRWKVLYLFSFSFLINFDRYIGSRIIKLIKFRKKNLEEELITKYYANILNSYSHSKKGNLNI